MHPAPAQTHNLYHTQEASCSRDPYGIFRCIFYRTKRSVSCSIAMSLICTVVEYSESEAVGDIARFEVFPLPTMFI